MPIKPDQKARYPKDWPAISQEVRARAGNRCEECGVDNYALGAWLGGKWHVAECKGDGLRDQPRAGEIFPCRHGESVVWMKVIRIVLTCAHLDHTPENNGEPGNRPNLKALCQRHHLAYDRKHHSANAARTARAKRATADMIDMLEKP